MVAPVRLHVGHVRDPPADAVEVVQSQLDPRLVGDGEEVEDGVGGPTEGHHNGDRVLEGLFGHDLAGPDALLQELYDRPSRFVGVVVAPAVHRWSC